MYGCRKHFCFVNRMYCVVSVEIVFWQIVCIQKHWMWCCTGSVVRILSRL